MNPHNLQGILDSVTELSKILEKKTKAKEIRNSLEKRIQNIKKIQNEKTQSFSNRIDLAIFLRQVIGFQRGYKL